MSQSSEFRLCKELVPNAITEAAKILDYTGLTSPAEIADCAIDQIEITCYLVPSEFDDLYVEITRQVYARLGLDRYASDGTSVSMHELSVLAKGGCF